MSLVSNKNVSTKILERSKKTISKKGKTITHALKAGYKKIRAGSNTDLEPHDQMVVDSGDKASLTEAEKALFSSISPATPA